MYIYLTISYEPTKPKYIYKFSYNALKSILQYIDYLHKCYGYSVCTNLKIAN